MTALPSLRQLQFLISLAEEKSFTAAAMASHVTQPTLSAAIKALEQTLGTVLFERTTQGTVMTPAGEAAYERAKRVFAETKDLVTATRTAGEPLTGPFRLGVIPTIAPFLLPRILPALNEAFPNLELFLREDLTGRLYDALRDRSLDAALIALPYEAPLISSLALASEEFLIACSPSHPLAKHPSLTPEHLSNTQLLLLDDGHCLRDHALAACSAGQPNTNFAAISLHTLVQMVKTSKGMTLLPKMAIEAGLIEQMDLKLIPFDPPVSGREIGISWRTGSARSTEIAQLGDIIRHVLNP